jgi:tuftelin-interacting protein 11
MLPGLLEWRELLRSDLDHILVRRLLPKLARHLAIEFEVDPSDQDLTPLENVLHWQTCFQPDVLARLLVAEFFPKWLSTLHQWLTADGASFDEIAQWLTWWKQQLPEPLQHHPAVAREWDQATHMINAALDLFDAGAPATSLAAPAAGPARPIAKEVGRKLDAQTAAASRPREVDLTPDFRDIVEAWCAEHDLTLVPLREAHPQTGAPLFRITASATGRGGVVVFLKGDVVWAQRKRDRTLFEPVGLEDTLVERAEGK